MRRTWDALAGGDTAVYVGDPATGASELAGLFGRLGADPRGGTCVEVGCGPGRMTGALAERFDRVLALDVSPAMLEQARTHVAATNVTFLAVPGDRLDVGDGEVRAREDDEVAGPGVDGVDRSVGHEVGVGHRPRIVG